jgi:hypothetical protein
VVTFVTPEEFAFLKRMAADEERSVSSALYRLIKQALGTGAEAGNDSGGCQ